VRLFPLKGQIVRVAGVGSLCLAMSACASVSDYNPFSKAGDLFTTRDWAASSQTKTEASRVLGAEDYISADGACAGQAVSAATSTSFATTGAAPDGDNPPGPVAPDAPADPLLAPRGGIALGMTECEVARRAGSPERVELGSDNRGERAVTLTYMRGERAGIYRFREGRLFTIERVAAIEPEKPKKPVKTAKPAKPAQPKPKQTAAKTDWPAAPPLQGAPAQAAPAQAGPWPAPQQAAKKQDDNVWPSPPPLRTAN
jgi:hypothetical protein